MQAFTASVSMENMSKKRSTRLKEAVKAFSVLYERVVISNAAASRLEKFTMLSCPLAVNVLLSLTTKWEGVTKTILIKKVTI